LGNVSCYVYQEFDTEILDLERLTRAWQKLIERHDMLRAVVLPEGRQQILEHVPPYRIEVLDLREEDPATGAAQLEAVRERMSHQVLPSGKWPLFEIRASLLNETRFRLHFGIDLLICDFWSLQIIIRDFLAFYKHPELPSDPLELSFRDCVLGSAALKDSILYQRSWAYWQHRIPSLPPGPELPLARNPASITRPRFVRRSGRLSREQWDTLKERAAAAGLTPSGILLGVFCDALYMWSANARFTLNLTLFSRLPLHPQINEVIGDFTSLSLLEVDATAGETFVERARNVQEQLWEDMDHRWVNGVEVLRELIRSQGRNPGVALPVVFTSGVNLEHFPENLLGEPVYSVAQTPQVWLDHLVYDQAGELGFHWDSVEELFPSGMLDEMFAAYCTALQQLSEDAGAWAKAELVQLPAKQAEQRQRQFQTSALVLDERLQLRATGVTGEIYVSDVGLGQSSEQAAESFIDHPRTGQRLYRTGDLGRYREDGEVEFLGSADIQVQSQEYRVDRSKLSAVSPSAVPIAKKSGVEKTAVTEMAQLIAEVLEIPDLDPNADLVSMGINSLHIVRIANALEQRYGVRPQLDELFGISTVAELFNYYEQKDLARDHAGRTESQTTEILIDPVARDAFKERQLNLRRGDDDRLIIGLPQVEDDVAVQQLYLQRRSHRKFAPEPIPLQEFARFMSCLRQIKLAGKPKYQYVSAGGLYPVQAYLHIKPDRVEGVEAGTYYYHPVAHHLSQLSKLAELDRNIHEPFINRHIYDEAALSIFLIAELNAITPLYGNYGLQFATLEAGYLSQLLMSSPQAGRVRLCPIGNIDFEKIRHLFALEPSHVLVHSLLGGLALPGDAEAWGPVQETYYQPAGDESEIEEGEL
jgi:SagB-type dehydrogenase family enzyme